jgi:uncharacterized protein (DUF58 family)
MAVLGAAVVGVFLGRATASRGMFLFVYGAIMVVIAAWLLGRKRLSVDSGRSDLPSRVREGQVVSVELRLEAKRRVTTVVLEETLPGDFGLPVRVPVPVLPAGQVVEHAYSFVPRRRGIYEIGPLTAEWSDPFGFTRRREVLTEPARIIVHPSTEPLTDRITSREWEDPPIRPPVSKPWPSGFEFYGMRDYVPGDDPRRIVWRKTAQTMDENGLGGRYLVRESEQGITDRVNVYLDTTSEDHSPGSPSETFELAVRTAASLGAKHLKDGFSVNLVGNDGPLTGALRGGTARITMLDALAAVQQGKEPFQRALDRLLVDPKRSSHNVLITPYVSHDAAARLQLLRNRGTSMLLVLVLWEDSDPVSLHRAGGLGVNVVEVRADVALDRVFARIVTGGRT